MKTNNDNDNDNNNGLINGETIEETLNVHGYIRRFYKNGGQNIELPLGNFTLMDKINPTLLVHIDASANLYKFSIIGN